MKEEEENVENWDNGDTQVYEEEFNLSEYIRGISPFETIRVSIVKEFIRRLKEEIVYIEEITRMRAIRKIDKLAGEKLVEEKGK